MGDAIKLVKLKEQKRIGLDCPNCNFYGLMNIKVKTFVEKRINYYVCCPKCSHNFKQIGRRFNVWRHLKKKHKLKHEELRTMQKDLVKRYLDEGIVDEEMFTIQPKGFKDGDDEEKDDAKEGQENDGQKEVTAGGGRFKTGRA